MMKLRRTGILLICICALLILSGCQEQLEPTQTIQPTSAPVGQQLTAKEQYDAARQVLESASNWILEYTFQEQRTVGEDTYTKAVEGKASYSCLFSKNMTAMVEEKVFYGSYASTYLEIYCEEMAYSKINESYFKADMTPEAFVSRQLPAALLSSELYQTIEMTQLPNSTVIAFSDPVGAESWITGERVKLVSASGTATLDSSGTLRETVCQITYTWGKIQYTVQACVRATASANLDLSGTHQEHISKSTQIESLDVPKMLLQVVGDVYSCGKLYCNAVESIYSEAIPLSYSQSSRITLTGRDNDLEARVEYEIQLSDYRGDVSTQTQVDSFADGLFTSVQNGGKLQTNPDVTAEQMRSYCEDAVLSALAAPKYLKNASLTENSSSYRIEMTGNHSFVTDMMANITQFLQVDLDAQAAIKKNISAGGYLEIDRKTGLPTAMGLYVEREHTIDTVTYQLTYKLEQTMELSAS